METRIVDNHFYYSAVPINVNLLECNVNIFCTSVFVFYTQPI